MPSKIQIATLLGAFASSVSAHGHLQAITVDGTPYTAYDPSFQYQATPPEVIEWSCPQCQDNGFVDPSMYSDVNLISCHKNATTGAKVATVKAGGTIDIQWTTWPDSHIGPVIDYLAKVDDATTTTASALNFFKLDQDGYSDNEWAANKLIKNNNTWTVKVPTDIASGQYVLRHEIIALHGAGTEGGAQNYPKCINIEITGGGSKTPTGEAGNKLYTPTGQGIIFNVYSGGDMSQYPLPGPALYDGSSSGNTTTPTTPTVTSAPAVTSAAAATSAAASSAIVNDVSATPTKAAPTATATAVASSPAAPASSGLPTEFTLETFIAWLQKQAGSSSKVRRHARAF